MTIANRDQTPTEQAIKPSTRRDGARGSDPGSGAASNLRKAQVRAALFRRVAPVKIGRFTLLEPIGAGAMGEIYAAYDENLDRKVALKLVRGGSSLTAKADDRLLREAQTLAQVSHPNVVQIYEAGTYQGRLFIAMELIRGGTLTAWLRDSAQLPRAVRLRETLHKFVAAGRGLEAAHAAGVAHRDFKPDNVLVGDDGRVRVVDFGLARALVDAGESSATIRESEREPDGDGAAGEREQAREDISLAETMASTDGDGDPDGDGDGDDSELPMDTAETVADDSRASARRSASGTRTRKDPTREDWDDRVESIARRGRAPAADPGDSAPVLKAALRLTETGTVMGTPRYMAPEQMRGALADHRSDQFSFCVALYHALYEMFPFSGDTFQELKASVETGEIKPAATSSVPSPVRKALHRGLSVEPSRRFDSMAELLAALEYRPRRRRSWLAAAAAAFAVLLGVMVYLRPAAVAPCASAGAEIDAVWSAERRASVRAVFVRSPLPYADAAWRGVERLLDGYADAWRGEAGAACEATNVAGTQSAELLDKRMLCLARGRSRLAALVDVLETGAPDAPDAIEHAVEAAADLPDPAACGDAENLLFGVEPPADARLAAEVSRIRDRLARARTLQLLGRYDESLAIAREVVATTDALGYPPVHAEALAQVGRALDPRGTGEALAEAEAFYFDALDIAEAQRHDQLAVEIGNKLTLMATLRDSGTRRAHAWWRRNRSAVGRIGDNPYEQAKLHHTLGELYYRDSKLDEAAAQERLAIDAIRRASPDHPELMRYYDALAKSLVDQSQFDEAISLHEKALAIATEHFGAGHPNAVALQINYGRTLKRAGQLDRARSQLEQALAGTRALHGDRHRGTGLIHALLASFEYSVGQLDAAGEHARAARQIYERVLPPGHERLTEVAMVMANIESKRGNFAAALAGYEQVLADFRRDKEDDHRRIGEMEGVIAEMLVELGRYDEGLPRLEEAERIFERRGVRDLATQAWIRTVRGEILVGEGRFGAAVPVLERALALFDDHAADPLNHALAMWTLARALHKLGRDGDRVRQLAERSRSLLAEQRGVSRHWLDAVTRFIDGLPARRTPLRERAGGDPSAPNQRGDADR